MDTRVVQGHLCALGHLGKQLSVPRLHQTVTVWLCWHLGHWIKHIQLQDESGLLKLALLDNIFMPSPVPHWIVRQRLLMSPLPRVWLCIVLLVMCPWSLAKEWFWSKRLLSFLFAPSLEALCNVKIAVPLSFPLPSPASQWFRESLKKGCYYYGKEPKYKWCPWEY